MGQENSEYPNLKDLRTLVIGCTPLARKVSELLRQLTTLTGVINLDRISGASKCNYDPMDDWTENDILYTKDVNCTETLEWISAKCPDIIIQCGWSQIFKKEILSLPSKYCIGIHPSPLPIGRGAAIINWKIIEGGGPWGNSLFKMEPTTDTGDIIDFEPFNIEPRDDVKTAYLKVDRTAIRMLKRTLPKIPKNAVTFKKQNQNSGTRYFKRTPEDGEVFLDWPCEKILNHIRALTHPFPGAFVNTKFGRLTVWSAIKNEHRAFGYKPGEIIKSNKGRGTKIALANNEILHIMLCRPPDDHDCWCDEWISDSNITGNILK